jgi:ABC-type transport system involved in multi-copper enzyme maturation permease subunit
MLSLIITDLKRILKDKLIIVIGILCIAFAIFTPLLLFAVSGISEDVANIIGMSINAKTLFFQAFNPANDFGLAIAILISIILCKDFSHGTIRNKIISGKTRTRVYLSSFIACAIVVCFVMVVYAFCTLGVSLLLLKYQATEFTASDFWYAVLSLVFKILTFVVVSALLNFLCMSLKNGGLCLLVYIAITMVFSIVGTALSMVQPFLPDNEAIKIIVEVVIYSNVFSTTVVGNTVTYSAL